MLLQAASPALPGDLALLWTTGIGAVTAGLLHVLKQLAVPISTLPDFIKSVLALLIAFGTTKLAVLFGTPIPPDLAGATGAIISGLSAMGLHSIAKAVGLIKPPIVVTPP